MERKPDKQTMMLLEAHLEKIKALFAPEKIILFGSRARGDHLNDSDIDLLVISKNSRACPGEREDYFRIWRLERKTDA